MIASLTPERQAIDARAFVDHLDAQSAVDGDRKMGTMGYCMGGPLTVRTAAARADRIGAGASFHGGGLVTDAPDSPHLLVPKLNARYLVAIAENDDEAQPEAKDVLGRLREAGSACGDRGLRRRPARVVPTGHARLPRGAGRTRLEPHAEVVRKNLGLNITHPHVLFWAITFSFFMYNT